MVPHGAADAEGRSLDRGGQLTAVKAAAAKTAGSLWERT